MKENHLHTFETTVSSLERLSFTFIFPANGKKETFRFVQDRFILKILNKKDIKNIERSGLHGCLLIKTLFKKFRNKGEMKQNICYSFVEFKSK